MGYNSKYDGAQVEAILDKANSYDGYTKSEIDTMIGDVESLLEALL